LPDNRGRPDHFAVASGEAVLARRITHIAKAHFAH